MLAPSLSPQPPPHFLGSVLPHEQPPAQHGDILTCMLTVCPQVGHYPLLGRGDASSVTLSWGSIGEEPDPALRGGLGSF